MEEHKKLVREELQTLRAEMKQGFAATMSSLTCSEHVSGFAQDTTTTSLTLVSRRAPTVTTGNGSLRNIHVELNTMPPRQQEAVPVQQKQAPPPLLIHTPAHQQPVVLTPIFDDLGGGTVFDDLSGPIFDDVDSDPIFDTSTDDMEDAPRFDIEPVFPGRVAAPLLTPDIKQSDGEVDMPAKCSTKCLSNGVE
jgi:hypothetical protein